MAPRQATTTMTTAAPRVAQYKPSTATASTKTTTSDRKTNPRSQLTRPLEQLSLAPTITASEAQSVAEYTPTSKVQASQATRTFHPSHYCAAEAQEARASMKPHQLAPVTQR